MKFSGVFQNDNLVPLKTFKPKLGDSLCPIYQQFLFVCGINPGSGDNFGPIARPNFLLISFHKGIKSCGIDKSLFNENLLHGLYTKGDPAFFMVMLVVVSVIMVFVHISWPCCSVIPTVYISITAFEHIPEGIANG